MLLKHGDKSEGIDFRIGLGVTWSKEDPTASRDNIARSLARLGQGALNRVE
jgi:hypothetical protein